MSDGTVFKVTFYWSVFIVLPTGLLHTHRHLCLIWTCWLPPFTSNPPSPERAADRGVAYLSWWSIPVSISHSEHSDEGFYRATQSWAQDGLEMRHIGGGEMESQRVTGWREEEEEEMGERWQTNSHVEQCNIRNNGWWQPRMTRSTCMVKTILLIEMHRWQFSWLNTISAFF